MSRIPREIVEEVRERADIVSVVSRHVQLKRQGKDFVGLCPFHQEKSPSFSVVPNKAMFYCFGCQAAGDVFGFIMQIEGLSFPEAVKQVAGQVGVEIPERDLSPEERRRLRQRAGLYEILEVANQWFQSNLWTTEGGAPARAYLDQRGITDEIAREAGLGWAPDRPDALCRHLRDQGYHADLAHKGGLIKPRDRGGFRDAYISRVIIPIHSKKGDPIGFGGRYLDLRDDGRRRPKYINSPETPLYDKSKVLYGLYGARKAIDRTGRVLLVEGYFDVISLRQAGFHETVAISGVALSADQVNQLRTHTSLAYVITDADRAGVQAAIKMMPRLLEAGIRARRVDIPDAKDPDDLIREQGVDAFDKALQTSIPLLRWVAERRMAELGFDAASKRTVLDELTDVLGHVSASEIAELASVLRLDERAVRERVRRQRPRRSASPKPERRGWRPTRDMVHLLWLLVHRYDEVADLIARCDTDFLARSDNAPALGAVARLHAGERVATLLDETQDPGVHNTLAAVAARAQLYTQEEAAIALCQVVARLSAPARQGVSVRVHRALDRAKSGGDWGAFRELAALNSSLKKDSQALERALRSGDVELAVDLLGPMTLPESVREPPVVRDDPATQAPESPPLAAPPPTLDGTRIEAQPQPSDDMPPPPEPHWVEETEDGPWET